jgi:hypothetical protein
VLPAPPLVDRDQVTPSVSDVSALERTRTIQQADLTEVSVFDSQTRPSDVEVAGLIDLATDEMLGQLPSHIDESWYSAISRLICLRASTLIEISYYRE